VRLGKRLGGSRTAADHEVQARERFGFWLGVRSGNPSSSSCSSSSSFGAVRGKEERGAESVGLLLLPLQAERSLCICCPVSKLKWVYLLFVSQHGM
jgi:hypothetical protein